jgi:hypothetical protein
LRSRSRSRRRLMTTLLCRHCSSKGEAASTPRHLLMHSIMRSIIFHAPSHTTSTLYPLPSTLYPLPSTRTRRWRRKRCALIALDDSF